MNVISSWLESDSSSGNVSDGVSFAVGVDVGIRSLDDVLTVTFFFDFDVVGCLVVVLVTSFVGQLEVCLFDVSFVVDGEGVSTC